MARSGWRQVTEGLDVDDPDVPIPRRPQWMVEVPLSAIQQRYWFLCTSYPGTASPIVYLAYRIRGPLDIDALGRALDAIIERHETLRSRFVVHPDGPTIILDRPATLPLDHIDLTGVTDQAERERRAHALLTEWTEGLIDLVDGPLVRARLLRMTTDEHVFCLAMHHIIADGGSVDVLRRDLSECYRAVRDGSPPNLAELPIGYGDFALWQWAGGGLGDEVLTWWRDQLRGVPPLRLRTDHPRPPVKGTRGAFLSDRLDAGTTTSLERLARQHRCSLFIVLLAAYQVLLAKHSDQDDICVGSPISGRVRVELEPLVGNFANILPLRGDLSGDPTFDELLTRTRAVVLGALARQAMPFGRIVPELDLPDDPSRMQVFSAIFVLNYVDASMLEPLDGVHTDNIPAGVPAITHDVILDALRGTDGLSLMLRWDSALFDPDTIAGWSADLVGILRSVVNDPQIRLSTLGVRIVQSS